MMPNAGFREVNHTADWELEVWAPQLSALLEQAAIGMFALAGTILAPEPLLHRRLAMQADDAESLLVNFLAELLFVAETEGIAFNRYTIRLDNFRLDAEMEGAPVTSMDKEIKAVTYHNLRVISGANGLRVNIIFDV